LLLSQILIDNRSEFGFPFPNGLIRNGNVFMFDFRSHSRSEGPPGTSMGYWEKLDVHGAVDWLLGRGETRFASFGISMGAVIMVTAENPYIWAVIAEALMRICGGLSRPRLTLPR
jgi:hypothetical protein